MKIVGLVLLLGLVGAACSIQDAAPNIANVAAASGPHVNAPAGGAAGNPTTAGQDLTTVVGPGISVTEALASDLAGRLLLVNGFIVTTADGGVYLAEALAESYPPQPGGARLVVENLDMNLVDGLTTAQGITWSDRSVQLLGTVRDGILNVGEMSANPPVDRR